MATFPRLQEHFPRIPGIPCRAGSWIGSLRAPPNEDNPGHSPLFQAPHPNPPEFKSVGFRLKAPKKTPQQIPGAKKIPGPSPRAEATLPKRIPSRHSQPRHCPFSLGFVWFFCGINKGRDGAGNGNFVFRDEPGPFSSLWCPESVTSPGAGPAPL